MSMSSRGNSLRFSKSVCMPKPRLLSCWGQRAINYFLDVLLDLRLVLLEDQDLFRAVVGGLFEDTAIFPHEVVVDRFKFLRNQYLLKCARQIVKVIGVIVVPIRVRIANLKFLFVQIQFLSFRLHSITIS